LTRCRKRPYHRGVKTPSSSLSQRLVLYGLGAGAASVAASHADAAILYSGKLEYSGNNIHFDLQNVVPPSSSFMPQDDFKLASKTSKGKAKLITEGSYGYNPSFVGLMQPNGPYIDRLVAGETIGNSSNFYQGLGYFDGPFNYGEWVPTERGFIGLRLTINGQNYFGWADVTFWNLTGEQPVFTLHSYAINLTPNESINAGQTKKRRRHEVVSPLVLLLAGASGVTALKRRRKKASL